MFLAGVINNYHVIKLPNYVSFILIFVTPAISEIPIKINKRLSRIEASLK